MAYGQNKIALLVGISNYKPGNGWTRISSAKDMEVIGGMLKRLGFDTKNIQVIGEEKATKQGIIQGLDKLAADAKPGDIVYFHFSGHGQQIFDNNGDEEDGCDEALVAWDAPMRYYRNAPEKHVRDDLLDSLFTIIREKIGSNGQLIVSLDECHSGTGSRAGMGKNIIKRGTEIIYAPPGYNPVIKNISAVENFESPGNKDALSPIIIIAACGPQEMNFEYSKGGCGSLSFALSLAFENIDSSTTYRAFFDRIRSVMARIAMNQMAQIEGDIDYKIFGGKIEKPVPYYTIEKIINEKTLTIKGGKLQNISEGSIVGFYPPDTRDTTTIKPAAYGIIISSDNLNAEVEVDNSKLIDRLSWVILKERVYPFNVSYGFSSDFPLPTKNEIEKQLSSYKTLTVDKIAPDVFFDYQNTNGISICRVINTQGYTVDSLIINNEAFYPHLKLAILRTGQANYLRGIQATDKNDSFKIVAEFIPVEYEGQNKEKKIIKYLDKSKIMDKQQTGYIMKDGMNFQIKLVNQGTTKVYYTIIDIQPNDKINFLIPPGNEQASSYSLDPMEQKILGTIPYSISPPFGNEVFEVISSKEPVELNLLQGATRKPKENENAFSKLLDAIKDDSILTRGLKNNAASSPVGIFIIHFKIVP